MVNDTNDIIVSPLINRIYSYNRATLVYTTNQNSEETKLLNKTALHYITMTCKLWSYVNINILYCKLKSKTCLFIFFLHLNKILIC